MSTYSTIKKTIEFYPDGKNLFAKIAFTELVFQENNYSDLLDYNTNNTFTPEFEIPKSKCEHYLKPWPNFS